MHPYVGLLVRGLFVLYAVTSTPAAQASDPAQGEALYKAKCAGCHAIEKNRIGPRHRGVFGRTAGSLTDFDYSPALKDSDVVWDERSLDSWLKNPAAFIPGQRMFVRVGKAADRAHIIAYLKQQKAE